MFQRFKINKTRFLPLILSIAFTSSVQAMTTREAGSWLSNNMMWIASAHTLFNEYDAEEDWAWANGLTQLHAGAAVSRGFVITRLKRNINTTRPDGGGQSFPSGHAARSFYPAWYVYHRYGFQQAAPYLLAATYSGYTRVDAKRHYWSDIAASAAITYAISHYMTSSVDDPAQPKFGIGFGGDGVWFNYDWRW